MNKQERKIWDKLREPTTHTCSNCAFGEKIDKFSLYGIRCINNRFFWQDRCLTFCNMKDYDIRSSTTKSKIKKDYWKWDGETY